MHVYQQTVESFTESANSIKEALISFLAKDGLLNGDHERIAARYVIVAYETGWFGKMWEKVTGNRVDGVGFRILIDPTVPLESEKVKE